MIARREFIFAGWALALPLSSLAQQGRVWRVGFLANGSRPRSIEDDALGGFPKAMRELGYVEGKNLVIEWRFSEGKPEAFASAAAELVNMNVDVLVAATGVGIERARRATRTIPIVMVAMSDPVKAGFVASFARPGGNITGLSNLSADTSAKYLELLRIAIPGLSSVAVFMSSAAPGAALIVPQIRSSAGKLGVQVRQFDLRNPAQIDAAFGALKSERAGAIIVVPEAMMSSNSGRIAELAIRDRVPTMFWTREHVERGGLMSYGQNNAEHYRRAAAYVDKILKGAKPGDLPVEQATKIELVINLRTAKAIGLAIPQELLLRADEVIE